MTGDAIAEAAERWYVRMHAPDADTHRAAFTAWQAADPRHPAAYDRLILLTGMAGRTAHRPSPAARSGRSRPPRWMLAGGAAALAAATVVAVVVTPGLRDGGAPTLIAQASAAPATFKLADGTMVTLNDGGRARVAMRPDVRHVVLEAGRATFAVVADATRPFVVDAGQRRMRAGATRFEVARDGDDARVALFEGELDIGTQGADLAIEAPRSLVPGEVAQAHAPGPAVLTAGSSSPSVAGRTTIDDRTLAEVAELANRFDGPTLTIAQDVAGRRVTGVFDVRDHAALARKLAAAFDLRVETTPGSIVLRQK